MSRLFFALSSWVLFAPIFIAIVAGVVTIQMLRYKWIVHTLAFAAFFFTFPVYHFIEGILDPTIIEYPGPGEGFGLLFYVINLVPTLIIYSVFAWFTRSKSSDALSSP
jgi:hypothetical protein